MLEYRSDTFTKPTKEMKELMINCELGDDVYGEDPTVNELEAYTSDLTGKEASIFVPTCTMANLIAVGVHCNHRFSEIILGEKQHIHKYEVGGISSIASVHSSQIPNFSDGSFCLETVENKIRESDVHYPYTKLICVENTHNVCGGRVLKPEFLNSLSSLATKNNIKLHMDGARVLNASVASKLPLKTIVSSVDSVSICLSKGLAAPAGALLSGSHSFIKEARHFRKALGGGMRQAGILAACGLVGLKTMSLRLEEDHLYAYQLATALDNMNGLRVNGGVSSVETNMFYLKVENNKANELSNNLRKLGVLVDNYGTNMMRLVTHKDVSILNINKTIDAFAKSTTLN